jgi:hypothetical protein
VVPKTTLRFNNLLEGLTELGKAVKYMVLIFCNEKIKSAEAKYTQHRFQETPGTNF